MTGYDQLNSSLAPTKSVFDSQRLARPLVYRHCGRASLCIGSFCVLAEVSVFVVKRGLSSAGVGIWTGAPFVIFGAATLAVPRTRTVCSVNTCFAMGLVCMVLSALGTAACVRHIGQLADILDSRATPRPSFELSCRLCGQYIILKEVVHIGLLLLQFAVSAALNCFAYADCLCCQATETEVILGGGDGGGGAAATATAAAGSSSVVTETQNTSPPPPPPPLLAQQQQQAYAGPTVATVSANSTASQFNSAAVAAATSSSSEPYVGHRQPGRYAAAQLHSGSSFGPPPMLYDL